MKVNKKGPLVDQKGPVTSVTLLKLRANFPFALVVQCLDQSDMDHDQKNAC